MTVENPFQGQLFADGFLCEAIAESEDWQALDDAAQESLRADLRAVFDSLPADGAPNESQTETDLIRPLLERLGWTASLWQQRLSARGRTHILNDPPIIRKCRDQGPYRALPQMTFLIIASRLP